MRASRSASPPRIIGSFAVREADTVAVVDTPATRIALPLPALGLERLPLRGGGAVGFGLALAFVFGLGTALSVGSGRADEDGVVDGIVGDCDSTGGEAGGEGAIVRVGVAFEPSAEGCGSGAGESTVAVVGW